MWTEWIQLNWPDLVSGKKLEAPPWLPHPSFLGFTRLEVATPMGQISDWALPYTDGSRVHAQEYQDGRWVVHRDRYDPAQGFGNMLTHLMTETFVGPLALVVGVIALARSNAT